MHDRAHQIISFISITMIRRPQPIQHQNSSFCMSIDYSKTQLPLATVTRSRSCSPVASSHSPHAPIIKPPTAESTKRGGNMNTMSILYVITLIGVVLYSRQYVGNMRIQYQSEMVLEREQWESEHSQEMHEERQANERLVGEMESFTVKLQGIQQAFEREQHTVAAYKQEVQTTHDRYEQLEKQATSSTESLKHAIQDVYRRNALREFGPGPHHVEFELDFGTQDENSRQFLTVQLAPLDYMPVTVYTFLQQVAQDMWDGSGFFINAPHVLMTKAADERVEEFSSELLHVPFEEYSEEYPHKRYTLGLAGHPLVGPDWYVNLQDNSENHGPQGPLRSGGEPCFGEVIIGREVIDRATQQPMGESVFLKHPVAIVGARLVNLGASSSLEGDDALNDQ